MDNSLQGVFAPRRLLSFNRDWKFIGSLQALVLAVSDSTGIDEQVLLQTRYIGLCCLPGRFHRASQRFITREEDMAHCLLGTGGINMLLLY